MRRKELAMVRDCNAKIINREIGRECFTARGAAQINPEARIAEAGKQVALCLDSLQWCVALPYAICFVQ